MYPGSGVVAAGGALVIDVLCQVPADGVNGSDVVWLGSVAKRKGDRTTIAGVFFRQRSKQQKGAAPIIEMSPPKTQVATLAFDVTSKRSKRSFSASNALFLSLKS
jgi:hypothetical protein